jgi:regulator of cell morphogenesis and NO signaling
MTMITPSTSLAEIVSTTPALTRELERLGLDYCCGGKRSLAEACREQHLDPEVVIAELTAHPVTAEPPADWIDLAPAELVDHLEATHHRYLKDVLPRLTELAAKVSRVHGEAHPELIRVADVVQEIRADLEPHLRKEEEVLFPMIRSLATASTQPSFHCGSIANPIAVMEQEHVAVGALLEQLRALTNGYQAPAGTCASTQSLMAGLAELEADTHLHVHKENNHLFPAVLTLETAMAS